MRGFRLLLTASTLLSSCQGDVTLPALAPPPSILIVRVEPSGVAVQVGTTLQMSAGSPRLPEARWNWLVNDTSLARISRTGLLDAKRAGLALVQACVIPPPAACGVATLMIVQSPAPPIHAQRILLDPDAAEVAALLRFRGVDGQAVAVLTQRRGPRPQSELDAMADTLLEIAISYPGDDARGARTRGAARSALVSATLGLGGGSPYAGGPQRLVRIAVSSSSEAGGALWGISQLPDTGQALGYMEELATSRHRIAWAAVELLSSSMGAPGLDLLHRLYVEGAVTEPRAREILAGVASYHRWSVR